MIYPVGSEYALCHAEAQIMSAVVGVLNENLLEGVKGFYKLRKAYISLSAILDAEAKFMRGKNNLSRASSANHSAISLGSTNSASSEKLMPGGFGRASAANINGTANDTNGDLKNVDLDDDDDDDFADAEEDHGPGETTEKYLGHVDIQLADEVVPKLDKASLSGNARVSDILSPAPPSRASTTTVQDLIEHDPSSELFTNPIDAFIHSGANLYFGFLLVLISMIPPAFSRLLLIIGFKGDRERGIRMLWQASKFHNINGAMAGLITLGFYNGMISFCDVIPDSTTTATLAATSPEAKAEAQAAPSFQGYPKERLKQLLGEMRTRYPKSRLWLLEEARMQAADKNVNGAITLLEGQTDSPLKQVKALSFFEKSLNSMYAHRYALCAESFITCCSLNNWSHALYYYIAGCCHVEEYRLTKGSGDAAVAKKHAEKAIELILKVRQHAGKKKFMARQLPFDVFIVRKLGKWEARAKDWGVELIDAIGVSPLEEMIYFWNGYKRMNTEQLERSLEALAWSEDTTKNPTWAKENLDETAILAVLRASVCRNMGRHTEAMSLLQKEILVHDRMEFKGKGKDDWTCPVAHYEMGANLWGLRSTSTSKAPGEKETKSDLKLVVEAETWMDKAAKWETYELDARMGLKVTTAAQTLKRWREARAEKVV